MAITLIVGCVTVIYCVRNFKNVQIEIPRQNWDFPLFKELMSFSGWSLFGSVASMTANQGLNILLNLFFGVVVNAAMGIASQVNAAIVRFVGNFQVAFRPQLVKYYAQGNINALRSLIINTSKYSYLLLFAIVCPVCFNIDLLLKLWLKNPPEYAAEFCIMMLIYALLETLSAPMWMTVQATGKIKRYQIIISCVISLNIIISYLFLKAGFGPVTVLIIKCCLDIVYLIVRLIFMKVKIQFPIKMYLSKTLFPISVVTIISVVSVNFISKTIDNGYIQLIVTAILFVFIYSFLLLLIAFDKNEKKKVYEILKKRIRW